uniref:Cytochrome b6-f complex subunit PetP n=1 Tax=Sciadococcus taiwanensis TaxID=3028030 RepID=A0A9Y1I2A2_9RHOD|nr:hypothetical protein SCTW_184 [Sciadococcus taiwanensis]
MGQPVKLIKLIHKVPLEISDCFGTIGIIKGFRLLSYNFIVPVVEFDSHIRIWLFENEIEEV